MSDNQRRDRADDGWSLKTKLILGGVGLAALAVLWVIAVAVIPRWWAQRIGNAIDGRLTFGSLLGITIGLVFTLLPLLVLLSAWRWRGGWQRWIFLIIVAALLASPNLATLGITFGNGSAAHAGDRILDVDGPGFRGGTYVGMGIGVMIALGIRWLLWSRGRNKRRADELARQHG